jgi:hypothetical protein
MSGFAEYTRNEIGGIGPRRAAEMAKPRNRVRGFPLAKEVFHPLVPSLVVAVDAAGVDPVEHLDAVPGPLGHLGAGAPALSRQETPAWRKS